MNGKNERMQKRPIPGEAIFDSGTNHEQGRYLKKKWKKLNYILFLLTWTRIQYVKFN